MAAGRSFFGSGPIVRPLTAAISRNMIPIVSLQRNRSLTDTERARPVVRLRPPGLTRRIRRLARPLALPSLGPRTIPPKHQGRFLSASSSVNMARVVNLAVHQNTGAVPSIGQIAQKLIVSHSRAPLGHLGEVQHSTDGDQAEALLAQLLRHITSCPLYSGVSLLLGSNLPFTPGKMGMDVPALPVDPSKSLIYLVEMRSAKFVWRQPHSSIGSGAKYG